jgi:DNA repair protein RecO (recombination protein O)
VTLLETEALVVRAVDVGESDVVVTLVTREAGKVAAVARGARKGSARIGGAIEPVHTVSVLLDDKGGELATIKESRIVVLRPGVVADLDALDAAGVALRWARHLFPPRTPEPRGWVVLIDLLDALERGSPSRRSDLARAGLAMLVAVGYGLELDRCVVCGRPCPDGRAACLDPVRGGLVCRACGGSSTVLTGGARDAARALAAGGSGTVNDGDARVVLGVVDRAMAAHAGFER